MKSEKSYVSLKIAESVRFFTIRLHPELADYLNNNNNNNNIHLYGAISNLKLLFGATNKNVGFINKKRINWTNNLLAVQIKPPSRPDISKNE